MHGAHKALLVFASTLLAVLLMFFVSEAVVGDAFKNDVMWHGHLGGGSWM